MHEPAFWYRPSSWMSRFLMPVGAIYGAIAGHRLQREGLDAGIPVLCVGNYHVGGAGKTPTVLALAKLLRELGETPVVLSRGYGGQLRGPILVDLARHAAADVGDEPLMMAADCPGGRCARSYRWRGIGTLATRQRHPDGRWLPESGGRQGCLADRDRWRARPRQCLRVSRRSPACAAAAAIGPYRCIDCHRWRDCGPMQLPPPLRRRASRYCGRICGPTRRRSRRCAASGCWLLPGSAIPRGFSGRCVRMGSRSSRSVPSPITIRFRKVRSRSCARKPGATR